MSTTTVSHGLQWNRSHLTTLVAAATAVATIPDKVIAFGDTHLDREIAHSTHDSLRASSQRMKRCSKWSPSIRPRAQSPCLSQRSIVIPQDLHALTVRSAAGVRTRIATCGAWGIATATVATRTCGDIRASTSTTLSCGHAVLPPRFHNTL